jgi:Co/Zn/Cd efflux system component
MTMPNKTIFAVPGMDCPSEEQAIRMRLADVTGVQHLRFDLDARQVQVWHEGEVAPVAEAMRTLGMGAKQAGETEADTPLPDGEDARQRGPLAIALAINAAFFIGELTAGLIADSMGLVADSLDMLADALVYALSLAAVGGTALRKRRLARSSGYLQLGLALFGLIEVVRRFVMADELPGVTVMVVVATLALVGNVVTLLVLRKAGRGEAHVEASWIFTSNDIKVNGLVIASALVVWATGAAWPDLLAGAFIFAIVANGARRILKL